MTTGEKRQPKETRRNRYELLAWRAKKRTKQPDLPIVNFWVDGFDGNKEQK